MPNICPKTEDFVTFLCFRGTTLLPESLNIFNTPFCPIVTNCTTKSVESPIKSEKIQATEAKTSNNVVSNRTHPKIVSEKLPQNTKKHLLNKNNLGMSRIHSNFRKRIGNTQMLTRLNKLKLSKDKKSKELLNRVSTRSQRRGKFNNLNSGMKGRSRSSSTSSSSTETSSVASSATSSSPSTKSPVKKSVTAKPTSVKNAQKPTENVSPQRKTRQSVSQMNNSPSERKREKSCKRVVEELPSSRTRRRSSRNSLPIMVSEKTKSVKTTGSWNRTSPKKITREAARKLREELLSRISKVKKASESHKDEKDSGARHCRPSRRTKEAATLNMTLIGHEERDSSELEDTSQVDTSVIHSF